MHLNQIEMGLPDYHISVLWNDMVFSIGFFSWILVLELVYGVSVHMHPLKGRMGLS